MIASSSASLLTVFLRHFTAEDAPLLHRWKNDDELAAQTTGNRYSYSMEAIQAWIVDKTRNTATQRYWAICRADSAEMIGYISLNDIDSVNRRAYWGGILIGEKRQRNLAHSLDALFLMLRFAFEELDLHKVHGDWLEEHKPSLLLSDLVGFYHEGVLRDHVFKGGRWHHVVVRSLLRAEYDRFAAEYGPGRVPPASTPDGGKP